MILIVCYIDKRLMTINISSPIESKNKEPHNYKYLSHFPEYLTKCWFKVLIRQSVNVFNPISANSLILHTNLLIPLAPHRCGFESRQGLWILSCEEAIQLAYGTSVVLLRCPFVPEIMHGKAPEVFLHQ
jgi:hypothetical protein